MFDIGFTELMLIAVVALVVLGPERLPKVARTVGHLLGRLQRYVSDVKADINREIQLDELKKMRQEMETSARDFETSVNKQLTAVESDLNRSLGAEGAAADDAVLHAGATPPLPEPLTEPRPERAAAAGSEVTVPAPEIPPQLELGLEREPQAAAGKS